MKTLIFFKRKPYSHNPKMRLFIIIMSCSNNNLEIIFKLRSQV